MKKLTAGIFTVLLGVVAANSADAALTSQKYVDTKVGVNAAAIKVNADDIATLKTSKADASTVTDLSGKVTANTDAIATKADKDAMDTALAKKQDTLTAGTGIKIDTATNTISTDGIATNDALVELEGKVATNTTNISANKTALDTLNGTAETTGSVANQIAAAITTETERADGAYDAKGAAATAEQNAKTYADGLAGNYATADQGKTADDTAAAVNNATTGLATKASTTYVNEELAKKQNTLKQGSNITIAEDGTISATYEYDDTGLAGRVTTLEGTGVTKEKIDAIATNTANITKNAEDIAKKQNTLTAADVTVSGDGNVITGITAADGKITATMGTTLGALATAAPGECSEATKFCALTFNGTTYKWEVIERVDGE